MSSGFDNGVMYATNMDLRGVVPVVGQFTTDGQMLIGSTAAPNARIGTITGVGGIAVNVGNGTLQIDGSGISGGSLPAGPQSSNLGFTYDGGTGTFTVTGATASLSGGNPAKIVLPSKSIPGSFNTYSVTADQSFTDGDLGTLFPQVWNWNPAGSPITIDVPFYIYAFADDSAIIQFALCCEPHYSLTSSQISSNGGVNAADRFAFYQIQGTNADAFAQKPALCVGSFRMRYSGTSWSVQTLSNTDGVGQFQEDIKFTVPLSVLGADANTWLVSDAGNPNSNSNAYDYWMNRNGIVSLFLNIGMTPNAPNGDNLNVIAPWTKRTTNSGFAYLDMSSTVLTQGGVITLLQSYGDPFVPSAFHYQDQLFNDITNSSITGAATFLSTMSFNMAQPT